MKQINLSKNQKEKLKNFIESETSFEEIYPLPKYSAQIFNVISNTAQATRPSVVGQMSEIIPNFINDFYDENNAFPKHSDWAEFYKEEYEENYNAGLERLLEYVNKYKKVLEEISQNVDLAKIWYDRFILMQNFEGFQYELIMYEYFKRETDLNKNNFKIRKSTVEEESQNIDFVSTNELTNEKLLFNAKPNTYSVEKNNIKIDGEIIIIKYQKTEDNGLTFYIEDEDQEKIDKFLKK